MRFALETFSFLIGFATATIFWWLMGRMRPLFGEIRGGLRKSREAGRIRRSVGVEENHRRATLRRAQGMHLAESLFALNEIIQTPRLLAPTPRVAPDAPLITEDIVALSIPYMPSWPELAAVYQAPTLSLPQVVESGINFVITGQPGAGKTVSLAYLASLAANRDPQLGRQSDFVPFIYHIADLHIPDDGEAKNILNPIIDAASERASMLALARLPKFIELTFETGRALLLLDGFDELNNDEHIEISQYLKVLLEEYPKTQVVLTGCPEFLEGLLDLGFESLTLMPWNAIVCDKFIDNWGSLWTNTVAAESWSQGNNEESGQIDPLLVNAWLNNANEILTPLELTLKVWAGYAGDSLGPGVLDAIATHIRRLAPSGTPLAALETLGMQVALSTQSIFDSRAAREWVKNYEVPDGSDTDFEEAFDEENQKADSIELENPKVDLHDQKKQSGPMVASSALLNKMTNSGILVSHSGNRMRFLHPVFGGYLAGRGLAHQSVDESLLQQSDWSGKLLAMRYIAAHGDASKLANALLEQSNMPLHQSLFYTARWLRDTPRNAPWRGKVFTQLANLLQADGMPLTLRAQAVTAFYWSNDPGAGPLFRQFMQTPSFELLQMAALGSGAIRDQKSVEVLSDILNSSVPSAQQASSLALVAIGTTTALETVARALLSGNDDVRRAAAEALANDPNEGHEMLKDGMIMTDIMVRRAVIYGLARVDEDWAHEALENIQVEDDQWVVRNSASEVLESKNEIIPRIPQPLTPPSATTWVIEFAGKQGVGISPGSPATDVLIEALKSEVDEERLGALLYLKRMPSDGVITNLYHAMYRDDSELREAIFLVLCELAANGLKLPDPQQFGLA